MNRIRVLIVDDHAVVREGIKMLLKTEQDIEIVGEATDGKSAFDKVDSLRPDVALVDLVMPNEGGIQAITRIKQNYPQVKLIVLTTFEDDDRIRAAIDAGADGYLLKDADGEALLQAIYAVQRGDMPFHPHIARQLFGGTTKKSEKDKLSDFTEREQEVLQLIAKGLSNKEVANILHITEGTVKVHVSNVLGKLNVSNRTEAAIWAMQEGLISVDEDI